MQILTESRAEEFLEKNKFPIVKRGIAYNLKQAEQIAKKLGYPVVLKNPSILHKTEKNAVKTNVTKETIKKAYHSLNSKKVLVQKHVKGIEIFAGIKKDQTFNHVLAFGLGGIYTEILKDISFRICPITAKDALEMIKETKSYPLLKGARGIHSVDINLIKSILLKLSNLTKKYPNIQELDINPMMAEKNKVEIVDARIILD